MASMRREVFQHHLDRYEGDSKLISLYEGCNLFIGFSTSGKTYLCQKQIIKSFFMPGTSTPKYTKITVVTMNEGTGVRWRQFFRDFLNKQVDVIGLDELANTYRDIGERCSTCLKSMRSMPLHLIVFDDTSNADMANAKEQRRVKNIPAIEAMAEHGRNLGITFCALFQNFTSVPMTCWNNSKYIAISFVKNIGTRENHAFPKVLDSCTRSLDYLIDVPKSIRYAFFNREMNTMQNHDFIIRFEYPKIENGKEVIAEAIMIYRAS